MAFPEAPLTAAALKRLPRPLPPPTTPHPPPAPQQDATDSHGTAAIGDPEIHTAATETLRPNTKTASTPPPASEMEPDLEQQPGSPTLDQAAPAAALQATPPKRASTSKKRTVTRTPDTATKRRNTPRGK